MSSPYSSARLGHARLDDAGAEPLQVADPRLGGVAPLGLAAVPDPWRLAQQADGETGQARLRDRTSGQHGPHERDVLDATRHRPDRVERRTEREHAVRRDEPPLRLEAYDLTCRGGQPNGAARVRAE